MRATVALLVLIFLGACAPDPRLAQDPTPAYTCPQGWHWEPADYAQHGKWRPGHCEY